MLPESALDPRLFAVLVSLALAAALALVALRPAWSVRFPRSVLALVLGISLAAALALVARDPLRLDLRFDASTDPLLPAGDPARDLYRRAIADFGDDEVYVIAVQCPEVFEVGCLSAMKRVSDQIARLPGVRRVRSLLDVTSFRYESERDWVEVRPFIEEIPRDPELLAKLRTRALQNSVYRRNLVSDDGRAAALNVSFRKMDDAAWIASGLDARIARILAQEAGAERRFYIAGRPHVKARIYQGMLRDLGSLTPLCLLAVGGVLWIATGNKRSVIVPLSVSALACLWTFGALGTLDRSLTLLTGLLGPTLLAVGSVYGVHFLARYEEELAGAPDTATAVLRCLEHVSLPVQIAGLTTAVGFAALLESDVPAVFELGAFAVLGVACITLLTQSFVPALLVLLPRRGPQRRPVQRALERALEKIAHGVERHATRSIVIFGIALAVAAVAIPNIVVDTDYLSYLDPSDPVRLDFEAVNRLVTGAVPLYLVLEGSEPGAFREPERLRVMQALQRRVDELPGVTRSLSLLDPLRTLNRAFERDAPAAERIPDSRPAVAELLFMIPKSDLQRFATADHRSVNLIVRTGRVGSAAIQALARDLERELGAAEWPGETRAFATGNAILLARSADGIARGQPLMVGLAAVAILALIARGLGSLRLGLLAMLPNLVPVGIFYGLLGLGFAPLSLPTSLIGSIALGIAIDDTVHFLVRYRAERRAGAEPEAAARACVRAVGRPIVVTSVMLSLGFLAVGLSDFSSLREFGSLAAITMLLCLAADLVLLPALLIRTRI